MDQQNSSQNLLLLDDHLDGSANEPSLIDNVAILKQIFKDLDQRSLLHTALACRHFKDPALDILWSSLDSLLPLLRLLRPFRPNDDPSVCQGQFDEAEWPIFDAYARRVKSLTFTTNDDGERVTYTALQRLSRHRPYFFPDLKNLSYPSILSIYTPLFSLLSPTLERLELGGNQIVYDEVIGPVMSTIMFESEESRLNLKRLILYGKPPPNLLDSLNQLANLQQLSISTPISFEFFKAVGRLDNLEDLTIVLSDTSNVLVSEPGFGNLRTLNITSPLLPLRAILEGILTTCISSIGITICLPVDQYAGSRRILASRKRLAYNKFVECFGFLNLRWRLSLRSITLDQGETYDATINLLLDLFSPLPCFEKVEHLRIHHSKFRPTDTGIHSLALACPNLQKLYFPVDCPDPSMDPQSVFTSPNTAFAEGTASGGVEEIASYQSRTTTTIASLWSLAELCPKLTHLEIGLNITMIPPFFPNNIHSHGLSSLTVGSYNGTNVGLIGTFEIARHIHRLFPRLTIHSHPDHNSMTWDHVGYAVDGYKKVVLDEDARRSKQHALNSQTVNFLSH